MLNSGGNKTNESLNTDVIQCDVTPEILQFFSGNGADHKKLCKPLIMMVAKELRIWETSNVARTHHISCTHGIGFHRRAMWGWQWAGWVSQCCLKANPIDTFFDATAFWLCMGFDTFQNISFWCFRFFWPRHSTLLKHPLINLKYNKHTLWTLNLNISSNIGIEFL